MNTPIIQNLDLIAQGKVRDIYAIDQDHLLLVTSDRMSAFDVVLPNPIPNKGQVLTELSLFWFEQTESIVANHLSNNFLIICFRHYFRIIFVMDFEPSLLISISA